MHCASNKSINIFVLCCSTWCCISWLIRFQLITCFSLTTLTTPIIRYDSSVPACLSCTDAALEHPIMYAVYKVVAGQHSIIVCCFLCGCGSTHGSVVQCCCPQAPLCVACGCISFWQHLHAYCSGSICIHIILAAFACILFWQHLHASHSGIKLLPTHRLMCLLMHPDVMTSNDPHSAQGLSCSHSET